MNSESESKRQVEMFALNNFTAGLHEPESFDDHIYLRKTSIPPKTQTIPQHFN